MKLRDSQRLEIPARCAALDLLVQQLRSLRVVGAGASGADLQLNCFCCISKRSDLNMLTAGCQ